MRIINVIQIKKGIVINVESFPVHEEQLSTDVVEQAEANFTKKALELGAEYVDMDIHLEDGTCKIRDASVNIFWSYIE